TLVRVSLSVAMEVLGITAENMEDLEDIPDNTESLNEVDDLVQRLMGKNADARFQFIQENAEFVKDIDV
ncbi:MAG TPA: hypothetical protein EYG18_08460, partial [Micavibrio sp.]|nr:hypothetical protein [Micavibrio sp.]